MADALPAAQSRQAGGRGQIHLWPVDAPRTRAEELRHIVERSLSRRRSRAAPGWGPARCARALILVFVAIVWGRLPPVAFSASGGIAIPVTAPGRCALGRAQ